MHSSKKPLYTIEFLELFNDNKGKWINGKYYTKEQLEIIKYQKNNGYEL